MDAAGILRRDCWALLGAPDEKSLPDEEGICRRGGESNERITLRDDWST